MCRLLFQTNKPHLKRFDSNGIRKKSSDSDSCHSGSSRSRTLEAVVRGGAHSLRLLGPRAEACEAVSPPEEAPSPPPPVEHSGIEGPTRVKEPILRINRAGQWYVETSSEPERSGSVDDSTVDGRKGTG